MEVPGGDRLGQAFGYSVEMTCHVEAYPPPTITWVHDGIQLSSNQFYSVDAGYTTTDDFTETRVRVKSLGPRMLGNYQCKAQNKLGAGEGNIEVFRTSRVNCLIGVCDDFGAASAKDVSSLCMLLAASALLLFRR